MLALSPLCAVQGCMCTLLQHLTSASALGLRRARSPREHRQLLLAGASTAARSASCMCFAAASDFGVGSRPAPRSLAAGVASFYTLALPPRCAVQSCLTAVTWHFHIVASVHALCNCRCDLRTQCAWPATYRFRGDALLGMPLMTSSWFVTFYSAAAGRALVLLGSSRARDSRGFLDPPVMSS